MPVRTYLRKTFDEKLLGLPRLERFSLCCGGEAGESLKDWKTGGQLVELGMDLSYHVTATVED